MKAKSKPASKPAEEQKTPVAAGEEATPEEAREAAPETAEAQDLSAKLEAAEERYLRLYAEFENYKKRTGRENEEFRKYANEGLLKNLLPVLDNLDRAIAHGREGNGNGAEKLLEGVEMIRRQFMDTLEKSGVTPIPALGEAFDPSRHQAVSQVETADAPDGSVTEEYQRGYFFRERVLRPAMVVVARNKTGG